MIAQEILNENFKRDSGDTLLDLLSKSSDINLNNDAECIEATVIESMENYAKKMSFLFSEFKREFQRRENSNHRHNVTEKIGLVTWVGRSDEKIWEAFLKNEQLEHWWVTEAKNNTPK